MGDGFDLRGRNFTAPMPGLKLTGDISAFPTGERWLYLATVLDLSSKELIGYAIAPHMRASLAIEAITAAHRAELVAGNAIMYTDRGWQGGFNWSTQHLDREVERCGCGGASQEASSQQEVEDVGRLLPLGRAGIVPLRFEDP